MPYQIGRFTVTGEHEEPEGEFPIRLLPHEHPAVFPWWSESTRAVLEALTPEDVAGLTVLDYGAGASAVLGIAAAKLGAWTVTYAEINPELWSIAVRQIDANGFAPAVDMPETTYDFALANVGDAALVGEVSRRATHGIGTAQDGTLIRW